MGRFIRSSLVAIVLIAALYDVSVYWAWIQGEDFAQAQEPAIKVNELARWQEIQLERLEEENRPFSIYEWQAGWDLTITEVKNAEWLDWNDRKLKANGQWLVIIGDIKNLTMEEISLSTREFVLRPLPLNGEYQVQEEATKVAGLQYDLEKAAAVTEGVSLKPGQNVPFLVAFDAPKALEEAALQATSMLWYKIGSVDEPATSPADKPTTPRTP